MKFLCMTGMILCLCTSIAFGQKGYVRGTISDFASGETLIGVIVEIQSLGLGAVSDIDGKYELAVAPGKYDIDFKYLGYSNKTITGVEAKSGEVTMIDLTMESQATGLTEIVVTAQQMDNSEVALMMLQKRALVVQDGISAQEISRYGSSDVAESMKRVTGASVVDGRFVVVRGLGDRYSTTSLNGMPLPSTDPYRNSTQLDLIPTHLLDNVTASKTFIPKLPGNFTGGNVDIQLKSFPDQFSFKVSVSGSYNDQSSFNDQYLTHDGGKTDWLGFDDGTRDLPAMLQDQAVRDEMTNSLATRARRNPDLAQLLDQSTKSTSSQYAPYAQSPLTNHGISVSIGNQYQVANNPLGFVLAANYNRRYLHYEKGLFSNWALLEAGAPELGLDRELEETRSVETPQIGGLAGLSYKFAGTQKITFNAMYSHEGEKDSRYLQGPFPAILSSGEFETRSIQFKERGFLSYQLGGEHVFGKNEFRVDWTGGLVESNQYEPDLRFFANSYTINSSEDTSYFVLPSEYPLPFNFYRELNDRQWIGKLDLTLPFLSSKSKANKIEFGGMYQSKDRTFSEDRFQYQRAPGGANYMGDPDAFFDDSNRGILDYNEANNTYTFGLFLTDVTDLKNSYTGTEVIAAAYGMVTYEWNRFKFITGARVEQTEMEVISADVSRPVGKISETDVLPSVNLIYKVTEQSNLRAAYSSTLARPNMRELAPFSSFEFIGDFLYTGNPNLSRTRIQNYDIRYEHYFEGGEMVALSGYFKNFNDPIVQVFVPEAPNKDEIMFENVDEALVYGVELELRKNLGFIGNFARNFRLISNLSFIRSEVNIPQDEIINIEMFNPEKGTTRPFQGQSPFLLNMGLNYVNPDAGIDAIVSINVFGTRLDAANFGGRPDVYEQGRTQLDFAFQKRIKERWNIRLSAQNLLDPVFLQFMEYNDQKYTIRAFERGRTFEVSLGYTL